jgi:hypothetical protein
MGSDESRLGWEGIGLGYTKGYGESEGVARVKVSCRPAHRLRAAQY